MTQETQTTPKTPVKLVQGWKKVLFLFAGALFFLLGALGAFLPGLPATPFLMLASYFLIRTSPKAHQALLNSRMFGPILVDWQVNGGVRRNVKTKATLLVVATVSVSIWLAGQSLWISIAVLAFAGIGLAVVWRLPDVRPTESNDSQQPNYVPTKPHMLKEKESTTAASRRSINS